MSSMRAELPENMNFCSTCGVRQSPAQIVRPQISKGRVGYSGKINDPAFAKYLKNTNRWSAIFSGVLAAAAVIGFTVAGEMGVDGMENPEALYIGLTIGGMFLAISLFTIISRKRSKTWDGVVVDKKINKKRRRKDDGDSYYYVDYLEYEVLIRADNGKTHRITAENDDTKYNYYQIGDLVRRHGGLNSYEKYDKSRDDIIFCNACATLCDISDDTCFRCKCPLLK